MLLDGNLVRVEPLVKTFGWYGGGWNFSPLGHRPGVAEGDIVPTYPMGFPVVMALTRAAFGEFGAYAAVPLMGAALVLGCFLLGSPAAFAHRRARGGGAGGDQPGAALSRRAADERRARGRLGGVRAGGGAGPTAAVGGRGRRVPGHGGGHAAQPGAAGPRRRGVRGGLAAANRGGSRSVTRVALLGLGLVPVLGPLMAMNLWLYGSASSTGYGGLDQYFACSNILPNVGDYFERIVTR